MGRVAFGIAAFAAVAAASLILRVKKERPTPAVESSDSAYNIQDLYEAGL